MKLTYTNTPEEVLEYTLFERINSKAFIDETKSLRNMYRILAALFGVWGIIQLVSYFNTQDPGKLAGALSTLIVAILTLLFTPLGVLIRKALLKYDIRKAVKDVKMAETTIEIDSRNMNWASGSDKGVVRLTEELTIHEHKDMYIIDGRKCRLAIPVRVFKNEEERKQFAKMINLENRLVKNK